MREEAFVFVGKKWFQNVVFHLKVHVNILNCISFLSTENGRGFDFLRWCLL